MLHEASDPYMVRTMIPVARIFVGRPMARACCCCCAAARKRMAPGRPALLMLRSLCSVPHGIRPPFLRCPEHVLLVSVAERNLDELSSRQWKQWQALSPIPFPTSKSLVISALSGHITMTPQRQPLPQPVPSLRNSKKCRYYGLSLAVIFANTTFALGLSIADGAGTDTPPSPPIPTSYLRSPVRRRELSEEERQTEQQAAFQEEREALEVFYNSTGGTRWLRDQRSRRRSGYEWYRWLEGDNHCEWYGVWCNPNKYVYKMHLHANNLHGTIPEEIGMLTHLQYLRLYDNNLTETIPTEIGKLTSIENLDLHDNNLTGFVPTEIAGLAQLRWLTLEGNDVNCSITSEIENLTQLEDFTC